MPGPASSEDLMKAFLNVGLWLAQMSSAIAAIDQEYVPTTHTFVSNVGHNNYIDWAQTFTVGITGKLTGFDVLMARYASATQPLRFEIRTTTLDRRPTVENAGPNILASGAVASERVMASTCCVTPPPGDLVHIDIDPIPVV